MLAKVRASALRGIEATQVIVEVNVSKGIGYHLVGLPDNAVRESNYRIASALTQSGYRIPGKKITINMAPADLRKEGAAYDLCIALGILQATGQTNFPSLADYVIMGELGLDGSLHPVRGALSVALASREAGFKACILPGVNAKEAAVVQGIAVYGLDNLGQVIEMLQGRSEIKPYNRQNYPGIRTIPPGNPDFAEVKGQLAAKRGLEVAASGGHNILMIGPPGSGKTMMARRLPGILPSMTLEETLETSRIHSASGRFRQGMTTQRPFRNPHHSISEAALIGGGVYPQPGEMSLAHNGVLFLDELPEFKRSVLEMMRQPLEDRQVTLSRSKYTLTYPCSIMLVASMNPSPSGYYVDVEKEGIAAFREMQRYFKKISGPLLDRIDMHLDIYPVPLEHLNSGESSESSSVIRDRVRLAREIQLKRF
jgi:magnesium chelatase family protein